MNKKFKVVLSDMLSHEQNIYKRVSGNMTIYGLLCAKCEWFKGLEPFEEEYVDVFINGHKIQHSEWSCPMSHWRFLSRDTTIFVKVGTPKLDKIVPDYRPQTSLPRECKNCGAPLHGHTCEYCGTEYGDTAVS